MCTSSIIIIYVSRARRQNPLRVICKFLREMACSNSFGSHDNNNKRHRRCLAYCLRIKNRNFRLKRV